MSKGLEAIRQYKQVICPRCQYHYGGECNNKDECFSTIIEKELKALKIVKKHIRVYKFPHVGEQIVPIDSYLTKEEYDLLKEVLL